MEKEDYAIEHYDKIRDIKPEMGVFNFKCFECQSENINLKPYQIAYKTQKDNSDLPPKLAKGYDGLPSKKEAILLAAQQYSIYYECPDCGDVNFIKDFIDRLQLTKWLQKRYDR